MTRDDVIRMAREAGFECFPWASAGPEEVIFTGSEGPVTGEMERFAELVAVAATAAEREACAQVCTDEICSCCWSDFARAAAEHIADAIRARGAP